ncbi:hypothetical protein ACIQX5_30165 [Bacillus thuringiensis]|uniref:rolling circle replication-associated protein n=1 Tax=Bacillus thuringiensis TaxID=1428 RepID=UPI00380AE7B2
MLKAKVYDMGGTKEIVAFYADALLPAEGKTTSIFSENRGYSSLSDDEKKARNEEKSLRRTKSSIRRYCKTHNLRYMWTLTFAKKDVVVESKNGKVQVYDAGDLEDAWRMFKNFLRRCRKAGLDFKYVATVEVQEKRLEQYGEKVFHFHIATDKAIPVNKENAMKFRSKVWLTQFWTHGFVKVTKQKSARKFANAYLSKYIAKLVEEVPQANQRYRVANNMEIPVEEFLFQSEEELYLFAGSMGVVEYNNLFLVDDFLEIFYFDIRERDCK